jgi:hypothetical protein
MEIVSSHRIEMVLNHQREAGDYYWQALEEDEPTWLEDRYDVLHRELDLDNVACEHPAVGVLNVAPARKV